MNKIRVWGPKGFGFSFVRSLSTDFSSFLRDTQNIWDKNREGLSVFYKFLNKTIAM